MRTERTFPCRSPVLVCSPAFLARCSFRLFQCVFLHLVSEAFPIRNAAFSMSCGNRDAAVPAKQIHPPETSSCFPVFSQGTIICDYFCGFCLFQEIELSMSEKTSVSRSSCRVFSISLMKWDLRGQRLPLSVPLWHTEE